MGKKASELGACAAPINLEQARAELVRAEQLLKQRHANTRLVLQKQKEITAQLQEANALVAGLQRRLKEEMRQKEKYKADCLKKDAVIAELRLQLRKGGGQAVSQSVTHPLTPSDEDLRSVLSERIREQSVRSDRSQKSQKSDRSWLTQRSDRSYRWGLSADSKNALSGDGSGRKRKVREDDGVDKRDMLVDMLDFILEGAGPGCVLQERVDMATENYLEEFPAGRDGWASEVANAAFEMLETCAMPVVICQWADMAWSPARWFESCPPKASGLGGPREGPQEGQRSLVATWCDPTKLRSDFIPWLLACLRRLEEKTRQRITYELLDKCVDEVVARCSETDARAVPLLCCASTVAIALCKMSGRRGLELAMTLIVDIMGHCGSGAKNGTVGLAAALEVWPELGVLVKKAALTLPVQNETEGNENDVYNMASLALRNALCM